MEGHLAAVRLLLAIAPNWLTLLTAKTDVGETAFQLANRFKKLAVAACLEETEQWRSLDTVAGLNCVNFPAHVAAKAGKLWQLRGLIESGAVKVNECDEDGDTVTHKGMKYLPTLKY